MPSLKVLFETIFVARRDLIHFTGCVMVLLLSAAVGFHMLYGHDMEEYSSGARSLYIAYLLMIGHVKFPAKEM